MDIFQALAEPNRRHIVELLAAKGQLSATDISNAFPISAPAISQHLKVLRESEIINVEKNAQQRLYSINPNAVSELEQWIKKLTELWETRFTRLDKLLKQQKGGKREE